MPKYSSPKSSGARPPSQRMLKVGEEVRHALASMFMRGELHAPELDDVSITVSEVRMTPDLKLGKAYIATLGLGDLHAVIALLNKQYDSAVRKILAQKVHLKFVPRIDFRADTSFDEALKINKLLHEAKLSSSDMHDDDESHP